MRVASAWVGPVYTDAGNFILFLIFLSARMLVASAQTHSRVHAGTLTHLCFFLVDGNANEGGSRMLTKIFP
jgi:hypothetical protein